VVVEVMGVIIMSGGGGDGWRGVRDLRSKRNLIERIGWVDGVGYCKSTFSLFGVSLDIWIVLL
jgi:hypothetical protein